jgi:hypothetical protein
MTVGIYAATLRDASTPLLLRASSSAKMLIRFRAQARLQVRAHIEDFERDFCLRCQIAPAEKAALHS